MAFEENKHPRDKDGKFTSKGNEGSKSSNNRQKELKNKYNSELPISLPDEQLKPKYIGMKNQVLVK